MICGWVPAHAQTLKDHLQKGNRYFERKDYENALKHLTEALALNPDDPMTNYKAGVSGLDQHQYPESLGYLVKAFQMRPDINPDIDYYLGIAYQGNLQYAEAQKHFESHLAKNKGMAPILRKKIAECIAGDSLMKLPVNATVSPLGDDINTSFSEFAPLMSPDGQTFIFSSNRSADPYEVKSGNNLDDVYISQKQAGNWSAPQKIAPTINVKPNEFATSISSDGTTLFLFYEDGGGDIYTSTKENDVWSKPVPLNNFINHPVYRESAACISADGKRLFFSSNRPGGKGGFDIYVSELSDNGQWGRPSNLGSAINTRKDEISPFIDAEGTTLYFASDGHHTLGDHDLFRSTFANGVWSVPNNLGYPINSSGYEGFLFLSPDKNTGYFSSRRKSGQTDTDIYSVTFIASPSPSAENDDEADEPKSIQR